MDTGSRQLDSLINAYIYGGATAVVQKMDAILLQRFAGTGREAPVGMRAAMIRRVIREAKIGASF